MQRFATVILSVFPKKNDRVGPVLLFKGKGKISSNEIQQYSKQVKVYFTPKAVMDTETVHKFTDYWFSRVSFSYDSPTVKLFLSVSSGGRILCDHCSFFQVKDQHPKLLVTDSYGCHLKSRAIQSLR